MTYLISREALQLIEDALKHGNKKDIVKSIEWVSQIKELGRVEPNKKLSPGEIGKIWEQECPSLIGFTNTLLLKLGL